MTWRQRYVPPRFFVDRACAVHSISGTESEFQLPNC
jgi:hypothetical protein